MSSERYRNLADVESALRDLGASENAVRFYLACYCDGQAAVGDVARKCGMDRSSAYLACDQLCELGLADADETGPRRLVAARPPSAVLARLRAEMRRLRRRHDAIEESLPQLLASYAARPSKPVLRFFSGSEGLRRIEDDVLERADGEILLLTNQRTEKSVFSEADHRAFVAERLRRGIRIRVLAADTPEARVLARSDAASRRETRLVDGEPFTSETYIYGDNVAMLSFDGEVVGFVVRSREFAAAQRWMFEQLWGNHVPAEGTAVRPTVRAGGGRGAPRRQPRG